MKSPKTITTRLQLPLGVASAGEPPSAEVGTLSFDPDTDTVRVKKSTGWADVGSSSTPPSGPAGGDLAGTYPNPTVAALHSATTSINVSSATAPSAGQVLTATDSTHATWQTPSSGGGYASWYLQPPASPNAFNDEFTSGSADLATRGWTFKNVTSNVTMTRVGDVYPFSYSWTGVDLAANTYRSSIVNSMLYIQIPASPNPQDYSFFKTITPANVNATDGALMWARVSTWGDVQIGQDQSVVYPMMSRATGAGNPDFNNRVQITAYTASSTLPTWGFEGHSGGPGTTVSFADRLNADIIGFWATKSGGSVGFIIDSWSGNFYSSSKQFGNFPSSSNLTLGSINFWSTNSASSAQNGMAVIAIDFVRLKTGDIQALCASNSLFT